MKELREIVSPSTSFYKCYLNRPITNLELISDPKLMYNDDIFYIAIADNIIEFFTLLLMYNARIYANKYIFVAVVLNRFDILKLLISLGLDPNQPDVKNNYPIEYATKCANNEIATYLYYTTNTIRINERLLVLAAQVNNETMFNIYNQHIKYIDSTSLFAIYKSLIINDNILLFTQFNHNRADYVIRMGKLIDYTHNTLMHIVIENEKNIKFFKLFAELLVKAGSNLNRVDRNGNTPLHLAYMNNSTLISFLIEHGSSQTLKNNDLKIPIEYLSK